MAKRSKLDRRIAEELLDNGVHPDDASPDVASLAAVLTAAATVPGPVTPDAAFMASLAAAVQNNPVPVPLRRKPVLARLLTAKAAAVATVMVFGVAGAAAATNNLPDSAQHGVATAVSHIGINLPDSANDHARDAGVKHTSGDNGGQPAADDNSNADDHAGKPEDNHGADVSGVAHETEPGQDHGATVCATASDGKCTDNRANGEDHTPTTVGNGGDEHENEHTTTTGVNGPPDEGHHGGGNSGQGADHSGRDRGSVSSRAA